VSPSRSFSPRSRASLLRVWATLMAGWLWLRFWLGLSDDSLSPDTFPVAPGVSAQRAASAPAGVRHTSKK
jgi:hypothetical protein